MKLDQRIHERLVALIEKGEAVLATRAPIPSGVIGIPRLDGGRYAEWRNQALVCLTQVFGSVHTYTANFQSETENGARIGGAHAGLGILRAAIEDVEQGNIGTLQEMAAAEVFSDFLDQAHHLLQNGYFAPAASLAGAVLENGLRSLAARNDIAVKSTDGLATLNNKIGDKGVYNRLRQKQISVWVGVRNASDHGRFNDFAEGDVTDLISGVRNLLADEI